MSNWVTDYHQMLQLRVAGVAIVVTLLAICCAATWALRAVSELLISRAREGIPICQRHTP